MDAVHSHSSLSLPVATGGWRDRLAAQIDRWSTSPGLHRWAVASSLTRWLVRRRSARLFACMAGFVHTQVLLACVRLRLLETLSEAPRTLDELAHLTGLQAASLQRLLDSAVAMGLMDRRSRGRYGLGSLGAPVATHAGIREMVEHNATLYEDLRDPLALLRDPNQAQMHTYWPYTPHQQREGASADSFGRYSALMSTSQRFVIDELLAAYPFVDHQRVLDIGGGMGGWVGALAQRHPHLQCTLFDLPPVAQLAREQLDRQGLGERITTQGGSFITDPLPRGADLVTLVRVAHDHDDATVLQLLRAIHDSLPLAGALVLAEPMANAEGQSPIDPYFHFYLMAMGSGRLRTPQALSELMAQAGFTHIELAPNPMPLHAQVLVGRKSRAQGALSHASGNVTP